MLTFEVSPLERCPERDKEVTTLYGVSLWRSIRSLWNEVKSNSKVKVLDGRKTRFWKDNWHEKGNMETKHYSRIMDTTGMEFHFQKAVEWLGGHESCWMQTGRMNYGGSEMKRECSKSTKPTSWWIQQISMVQDGPGNKYEIVEYLTKYHALSG